MWNLTEGTQRPPSASFGGPGDTLRVFLEPSTSGFEAEAISSPGLFDQLNSCDLGLLAGGESFGVRTLVVASSSPRRVTWRAGVSPVSKDLLSFKAPSPTFTVRPAARSSRAIASAAGFWAVLSGAMEASSLGRQFTQVSEARPFDKRRACFGAPAERLVAAGGGIPFPDRFAIGKGLDRGVVAVEIVAQQRCLRLVELSCVKPRGPEEDVLHARCVQLLDGVCNVIGCHPIAQVSGSYIHGGAEPQGEIEAGPRCPQSFSASHGHISNCR